MKAETASQLLSISIKNKDLDGLYLACSCFPWGRESLGFDPLSEIAHDLQDAKVSSSSTREIAQARQSWELFLQGLAQSGYSSSTKDSLLGLVYLGDADVTSLICFAKEALAYAQQKNESCWLLHDLSESPRARSKWMISLVDAGFDPHLERKPGMTPLHSLMEMASHPNRGVMLDRLDTIETMLDRGWDMSRKSSLGVSPADLARGIAQHALVEDDDKKRYVPVLARLQALSLSGKVDPAPYLPRSRSRL